MLVTRVNTNQFKSGTIRRVMLEDLNQSST